MDIRKINNTRIFLEWDELLYDYWELFDEPQELTPSEILVAQEFLKMMKIDPDQQELIRFRAAPVHFAHMIVHFQRRLEARFPGIFSKKFCDDIDNEI